MMENIKNRKQQHLDICLNRNLSIESPDSYLSHIKLPHKAMPEINSKDVSLRTPFLSYALKSPLMISCMTGGSSEGYILNRILAEAANKHGLAIGTGSIRVLMAHPETRSHFELKKIATDVPVLANIGAAQLNVYPVKNVIETVKIINADGLYIHLNSAQELFQDGGDQVFSGWYDSIARLMEQADFPVLIKETGAGIPPEEGLRLLKLGASFIDVAGTGGTDWVAVEAFARGFDENKASASFRNWGYSTGELLLAYRQIARAGGVSGSLVSGKIIASGGLRTPLEYAVSLACGAHLAAGALPFIRLAAENGLEAVSQYIEELETGIRAAIILSGSRSLEKFRKTELRIDSELMNNAENLAEEALKAGDDK